MEEVATGERADPGKGLAIQAALGSPRHTLWGFFIPWLPALCVSCRSGVVGSDVILVGVLLYLNGNC